MKRRPVAAVTIPSRPIEFWPRCFFLLVVRETPRLSLRGTAMIDASPPLQYPATPGVTFIEFESTLLLPRGHETRLDAAHTIRFCRFLNATRRRSSTSQRRLHFVVRSHVRGDEATAVELLVRWRLLSLQLSAADALAPFQHLQSLFHHDDAVDFHASLAGIAKGVASDLLFSSSVFQDDSDLTTESDHETLSYFRRITTRFLLFAGPVDDTQSPPKADVDPVDPSCDTGAEGGLLGPESQGLSSPLSVARLVPLLKQHGVSMVVKLNALPHYDDQLIIRSGVDHLDLSDPGHGPIDASVVTRFLESCEHVASPVAVHSSTGRGRAAFCIACFLIKHHEFTAAEAVGWLRFCYPQAIPSAMARQLIRLEPTLWRDGDAFRRRKLGETTTTTLRRQSLSKDDASQISIGQIALGRDSLLGTKDRVSREREVRPSPVVPLPLPSRTYAGSGSLRELIAADAVLGAQHTRRPLTQGAAGGRRRQPADHHHGSFATLHRFVHSSGSAASPGPSREASRTAPDRSVARTARSRSRGGSNDHPFD